MQKLLRHRPYLRALSRAQRRRWFEQWKTLTPKVPIGTDVLPRAVRDSFAYVRLQ